MYEHTQDTYGTPAPAGRRCASHNLFTLDLEGFAMSTGTEMEIEMETEIAIGNLCEKCGGAVFDSDCIVEFDGMKLCAECFDDMTAICPSCQDRIWQDEFVEMKTHTGENETVCPSCLERWNSDCDGCNDSFHIHSLREANLNYYCQTCFDERFYVCARCDDPICAGDERSTPYYGETVCQECFDESFAECISCETVYSRNDLHVDCNTDELMCSECFENRSRTIHEYSYKPDPEFHAIYSEHFTKRLPFGIEFEIDKLPEGEKDTIAEMVLELCGDFVYLKQDCSLEYGFEIVSHPATYRWHTEKAPWAKLLHSLRCAGAKSHDA